MDGSMLIANSQKEEIYKLQDHLSKYFNVHSIDSPDKYQPDMTYDIVLVDSNFTEFNGMDFLMTILSSGRLPALMVTTPDDSEIAAEAMNVGAFNYIVKTKNYYDAAVFAAKEALKRFQEQESKDQSIDTLKKRVKELEEELGLARRRQALASSTVARERKAEATAARERKVETKAERNTLADIVAVLKKEEINLPVYPRACSRLREATNHGASVSDIRHILGKDDIITSKMIAISNAPYYRSSTDISNLETAIKRIGSSQTRSFAEMIAYRQLFTFKNGKYEKLMEDLWLHSLACAFASQELTRVLLMKDPAELFIMGLLHDIGKLLLVLILEELETRESYIKEEVPLAEVNSLLKNYHDKFGSSFIKRWELSSEYSHVMLWHDNLDTAKNITTELLMVSLANDIVKSMGYGEAETTHVETTKAARVLDIGSEQLDHIKERVTKLMEIGLAI